MAHAVVQWTDNLAGDADIAGLLQLIAAQMRDSGGMFPVGGIRVRAVRLHDYVIADGEGDDAFVDIDIKMAAGREPAAKRAFFERLFEAIKTHFAEVYARRPLALSMYIAETTEANSFKHNNIHVRLAKSI